MPGNYEKKIGQQIAKIRKERNLTQAQLAEAIDVAPETISRLERGVSVPSLNTIEEISKSLNVSLKDIFDFEYAPKKVSPSEREIARVVALLKNRKSQEIKLAHTILKDLFRGIKKFS